MVRLDIEIKGVDGRVEDRAGSVRARRRAAESGDLNDVQAIGPFKLFCGCIPNGAGAGESWNKHDVRALTAYRDSDAIGGSLGKCGVKLENQNRSKEYFRC